GAALRSEDADERRNSRTAHTAAPSPGENLLEREPEVLGAERIRKHVVGAGLECLAQRSVLGSAGRDDHRPLRSMLHGTVDDLRRSGVEDVASHDDDVALLVEEAVPAFIEL